MAKLKTIRIKGTCDGPVLTGPETLGTLALLFDTVAQLADQLGVKLPPLPELNDDDPPGCYLP